MKRLFSLVVAIFLAACMALSAWAYPLPTYVLEDGNTVVKTFRISTLSESHLSLWRSFWADGGYILLTESDSELMYHFVLLPNRADAEFYYSSSLGILGLKAIKPYKILEFVRDSSTGYYEFSGYGIIQAGELKEFDCWVGHSYSVNVSLPDFPVDWKATYTGDLIIRTDEDEPASEEPEEPGNDGLLGWLSAFWDKLKNLFVSIFVPPDGYFTDWFNEIRSSFDSKFGNLGTLWDSLTASFAALKTSDANMTGLYLTIPNNHWFPGSKGISVNLIGALLPYVGTVRGWFNAILIVFTALTVYRNITAMLKK